MISARSIALQGLNASVALLVAVQGFGSAEETAPTPPTPQPRPKRERGSIAGMMAHLPEKQTRISAKTREMQLRQITAFLHSFMDTA